MHFILALLATLTHLVLLQTFINVNLILDMVLKVTKIEDEL